MSEPLRKVLLSGPIGSGKSSVGRLLADKGATVIDADRVGHQVLEPDGEAYRTVTERWPQVVDGEGRIDRGKLAGIVFSDPEALHWLEAMSHPHIKRRLREAVGQIGSRVMVVEVPLTGDFLGPGWIRVLVYAPRSARRARLLQRGMSEADVERRMAAQPPEHEWLEEADYVLDNPDDKGALRRRVDALWEWLGTPEARAAGSID